MVMRWRARRAGEEPVTGIVAGVTQSPGTTIISCVEDERLEFQVPLLETAFRTWHVGSKPINAVINFNLCI